MSQQLYREDCCCGQMARILFREGDVDGVGGGMEGDGIAMYMYMQ